MEEYRTTGRAVPIVALAFLLYAFLGPYFPGFLQHAGLSLRRVIQLSALELTGVFGSLPQMGITYIVVFIFWAAFAERFGVLKQILSFAAKLVSRMRYGLPQIAVIGSMIFGSFSGSAAANVAGTGSFTIPTMKKFGIPPHIAGAVEATASSGGQIMPPIMGAAAFIMADFLGRPYVDIMLVGFVPAIIFYFAVFCSVYFISKELFAKKADLKTEEIEWVKFRPVDNIPFAISLGVLLVMFIGFRMEVLPAGTLAILAFLLASLCYDLAVANNRTQAFKGYLKKVRNGVLGGAEGAISIMVILGTMGLVARLLVTTGLAQKLAFGMVDLSGGQLWVLVLLTVGVAVLFGMAVSTTVGYILLAIVAAPALAAFGIAPMASHFFIFYLVVLSALTPPVAIASVVASQIAGASFWKTCIWACRIGLPLFILPMVFISTPALVSLSPDALPVFALTAIGMVFLAYGLNAKLKMSDTMAFRVVCFALGLGTLFYPDMTIRWILAGVCVVLILGKRFYAARKLSAKSQTSSIP